MHACIAHLQQGLDTGLEDHVGVEQERAEQGLRVTGQLGHQPRQQEVDIDGVLQHVLEFGKEHSHEGAWGGGHKDTRPEHNAHHTHSPQNETPPPLDENYLCQKMICMFKYPVTTYSGGDKMADTTWTHKRSRCQLYTHSS